MEGDEEVLGGFFKNYVIATAVEAIEGIVVT